MSDYDNDILVWSERQGALLRRRAAGELVNDRELDWPNIADEIESVGRSQLSALRSYIVQALSNDLKAEAWPRSQATPGWRAEAVRFRQEAAEALRRRCGNTSTWPSSMPLQCVGFLKRSTASRPHPSPRNARSPWMNC
jgi:hypothetical protein